MNDQLFLKAVKLFTDKKFNESKKYFENLYDNNFKNPDLLNYLSLNYIHLSQFNDAIKILTKIIADKKEDVNNYLNLAYCYQGINDFNSAINTYKSAIKINPHHEQPYLNLGSMLRKLKLFEQSEEILLRAKDLKSHKIYTTLSSLYIDTKQFDKALDFANMAIEINQSDILAINNLASIYINLKNYDLASNFLEKGLKLYPQHPLIHLNLGVLNKNLNNLDKAKLHFQQSINSNPHLYDAYLYKSLIELSENNFQEGWDNYEYRWYKQDTRIKPSCTKWDGSKNFQHILLWGEQGLGEQILFGSIISEVLTVFKKITLVIDEKLKPIFQESFPEINVYNPQDNWKKEDFDCHLPMASLGKFFRKDLNKFDNSKSYLNLISAKRDSQKIRCGLSWKSVNSVEGNLKSLHLDQLLPLLKIEKIDFFNVQYTDEKKEIEQFNIQNNVKIQNINQLDTFNDLYNLSKYLKSFDFLVSISNTTAHLAGALGIPTLLLLPQSVGKLWYWSNTIEDKNLWYPTVKIFRQEVDGNWELEIPKVTKYIQEKFLNK